MSVWGPRELKQLRVPAQKRKLELRRVLLKVTWLWVAEQELKLKSAKVLLFLALHPASENVDVFVSFFKNSSISQSTF